MKQRRRIVVCDDEPTARRAAIRALGKEAYEYVECANGKECVDYLLTRPADLVLLDLTMPVMDGTTALPLIQANPSAPPVVVITADASLRAAIEAVRAGAEDFLAKPYEIDELRHIVGRVLETSKLRRENRRLSAEAEAHGRGTQLHGQSEAMREIREIIEKVAPTDTTVLITGETGTGKELAARLIHERSLVADGPFVCVNCAAIPETLVESELFGHRKGAFTGAERDRIGKFEEADGGTLFLDEIGDMPGPVQAKLLRVLQDGVVEPLGGGTSREVRVRFLAATHRDLKQAVEAKEFREDLLFRIRVVELPMPPLRVREGDVLSLAQFFLDRYRPGTKLAAESTEILSAYAWPGNVRELGNAMERAAIFCTDGLVTPKDLPGEIQSGQLPSEATGLLWDPGDDFQTAKAKVVERYERKRIRSALATTSGNVSEAARSLGIHRQNLQQKMKSLGIEATEFK